jgi:hypothetical protein
MGTYYTLGVIQKFTAQSEQALSEEKWKQLVSERIDRELFEIAFSNQQMQGVLRDKLFEDNIKDFYSKLKKITHYTDIDYYFKENGTQIANYDSGRTRIDLYDGEAKKIVITVDYKLLFVEGKVLAEGFSIEPTLINWLFRHSDFGNCLAGSIISDIFG